jgi:hypothetical protein
MEITATITEALRNRNVEQALELIEESFPRGIPNEQLLKLLDWFGERFRQARGMGHHTDTFIPVALLRFCLDKLSVLSTKEVNLLVDPLTDYPKKIIEEVSFWVLTSPLNSKNRLFHAIETCSELGSALVEHGLIREVQHLESFAWFNTEQFQWSVFAGCLKFDNVELLRRFANVYFKRRTLSAFTCRQVLLATLSSPANNAAVDEFLQMISTWKFTLRLDERGQPVDESSSDGLKCDVLVKVLRGYAKRVCKDTARAAVVKKYFGAFVGCQ